MKLNRWNRLLSLAFIGLMLFSSAASARETSVMQFARDCLTEVFGYTEEELEDFVFETREDGTVACWPKAHPNWIYTAQRRQSGDMDAASPFYTGFTGFCGENAVRLLLSRIREKGWIAAWSEESKAALLEACQEQDVRVSTEMYLSESPSQALQGFFESCYGSAASWTQALWELRDSAFAEYGLTPEEIPFHISGVRRFSLKRNDQTEALRMYVLFDGGACPDELKEAFSDPHLTGWACQSGALRFDENAQDRDKDMGQGLAAFEKDGKRQLVQLVYQHGGWMAYPLGTNALYPSGDYRVTFDAMQNAFAVQYRLNDDETASFYLTPGLSSRDGVKIVNTAFDNYERVNRKTGEAVWISVSNRNMPTWRKELTPDGISYPVVDFPSYLGVMPITEFPTVLKAARQYAYPGLPEGYAFSEGVNLRTQKSSRSRSHGVLNAGTLLPVLETLPGDPSEWIRTRVGFLEGYVTDTYVRAGAPRAAAQDALPVAETQKETALKKGTGLFDGTLQALPAGTKMHVIIDAGDWLYVDVPRGDIQFLMDVEGAFGYVRKSDVVFLSTPAGLDWAE